MKTQPDILVAVLNWGLGHATRSAVIIRFLLESGHTPLLLSSGKAGHWLRENFPELDYQELPDPNIRYARSEVGFLPQLLRQWPDFYKHLKQEQLFTQKLIQENPNIRAIISDHRLGVYHARIPSVLLAHQLNLPSKIPGVNTIYRRFLKPFHRIWVPDFPNASGLSGNLSHPSPFPEKTAYIGPLPHIPSVHLNAKHILILLSGPEPMRTLLENKLIHIWPKNHSMPVCLIRGTNSPPEVPLPLQWEIHDFANSQTVTDCLQNARGLIARNGYSTLMDIFWSRIPALLIPTPGQPEQLYLSKLHQHHPLFTHFLQKNINQQHLTEWLIQITDYQSKTPKPQDFSLLKNELDHFLQKSN